MDKDFTTYNNLTTNGLCGAGCISWTGIFIGSLFILGLSFLLNLFSAAVGLSAYHLNQEGTMTFALGGFLGLLIGTIAIMFTSGFIAGFMGRMRCLNNSCGGLYGFSAWAIALIVAVFLSAHVGKFVSTFRDFVQNPTYSSVATTANYNAPIVSTNDNQAVVNTAKVATGAFAIFILFLVGALASTIGGHYGLRGLGRRDISIAER